MKRFQRGAARISLVWMIAVIVLFIAAIAFGFITQTDAAAAKRSAEEAQAAADQALVEQNEAFSGWQTLAESVGWYDREVVGSTSDLEALGEALADLKATFPDIGDEVADFEGALPIIKQAFTARAQEISQLRETIAQLESEKTTIEQSLRDASSGKDTQLADLQRQIADEAENFSQQQAELENRISSLRTQASESDAEVRSLRSEMEDLRIAQREEKALWQSYLEQARKPLALPTEPEQPDGKVLQVSNDAGLGWIDIGRSSRLALGMRFRVVSALNGSTKAYAEVTRVEPAMAEVVFSDIADRFDPVVDGDHVFNPIFDPSSIRNAVLVGRFSGRYNEKELKTLLENMGIMVQSELGIDTDYMIVGSDILVDENGEPLEDPLKPSDLQVYKDAEAARVMIVPLKDLYNYFKY